MEMYDTTIEDKMLPLVSCIMPTYNRREFVPHAIRYFLRQDYEPKELIILDDGTDAIEDLVPEDSRIRCLRLDKKQTVGAKRNIACKEAKGKIIAHWDDDDWSAPFRLNYQVEYLLNQQADVCGLDQLYFYEPLSQKAWQYIYPKKWKPWLAGGTLCYKKSLWKNNPFPEINIGEDGLFVWSNCSKKILTLRDRAFYVALIHQGNISPKYTNDQRWTRISLETIQNLMPDDFLFYMNGSQREDKQRSQPASITGKLSSGEPKANELVSCILPTCNRPIFLRQAIRCFLRQTYEQSELIVVDDGEPPVEDLCSGLFRVHYLRLNQRTSLGEKLNIGIDHARGAIIQKWDDDDYYHPGFLEKAVNTLTSAPPGRNLVAWDCFLVLLLNEMTIRYSGNGWAAGGTLCFWRDSWEKVHFRDIPQAVDTYFIKDLQPSIPKVKAPELYILVRHGKNTWNQTRDINIDHYFQQLGLYAKSLENLVEPIDCVFYRSLLKGGR